MMRLKTCVAPATLSRRESRPGLSVFARFSSRNAPWAEPDALHSRTASVTRFQRARRLSASTGRSTNMPATRLPSVYVETLEGLPPTGQYTRRFRSGSEAAEVLAKASLTSVSATSLTVPPRRRPIRFTSSRETDHHRKRRSVPVGLSNAVVVGGRHDALASERTADTSSDRKSTRLNSSHSQISYAVF